MKIKDWGRVRCAGVFVIFVIILILIFIFCFNPRFIAFDQNSANFDRFIWTMMFAFFGVAIILWQASFSIEKSHKYFIGNDLFKHIRCIVHYSIYLIVFSVIIFALFNLWGKTSGLIYYWIAAATGLYGGYFADKIANILNNFENLLALVFSRK